MVLCDFVQVAEGKLFINGGGWNHKGLTTPMGVGLLVEVPWSETNIGHNVRLILEDADGHPVEAPGPLGPQPLVIEAQIEVGRPPGMPHGSSINVPMAINVPPPPLLPDTSYRWRFEVEGKSQDDWHVAFRTKSAGPEA